MNMISERVHEVLFLGKQLLTIQYFRQTRFIHMGVLSSIVHHKLRSTTEAETLPLLPYLAMTSRASSASLELLAMMTQILEQDSMLEVTSHNS